MLKKHQLLDANDLQNLIGFLQVPVVQAQKVEMKNVIYNSSIIKLESYLDQVSNALGKLNKKGEATLLYQMSRDGLKPETFWEKCKTHEATVSFVQTNLNSVIGIYNPDKWEDTTAKKWTDVYSGFKDIVNGKPFLFYFVDN